MAATLPVQRETNLPVESSTAKGSITCEICSSVFEPAPAHSYLKQSPQLALESAYMSMCHFCFRCRRPACPNCWDEVHGLCGICVEETHLTFRQEVDALPLDSTLLLPKPSSPIQQPSSLPLVCVAPGRFQPKDVSDMQEQPMLPVEEHDVNEYNLDDKEESEAHIVEGKLEPEVQHVRRFGRVVVRIERVMTIVLSVVLVLVVLLIVVASLSAPMNDVVLHLLHIDIRMEIRYLLQLVQQLASGG